LIVDIYTVVAGSEEGQTEVSPQASPRGAEDQTEASQQVAENQGKEEADSEGNQPLSEPETVEPPTGDSEPNEVKINEQDGSAAGQEVSTAETHAEATRASPVSPARVRLDGGQGGGPGNTPEEVLETLIASQSPEAAELLRQILNYTREKQPDKALELVARYEEQYPDCVAGPLMVLKGDLYAELGLQGASGSFAKAVAAYRDSHVLSGKSPLQPWALVQLGRIQLRQKRYLEALGYLDLVINKYPHSPHRAIALIHRGQLYLEKDRADLALDDFQQFLSEYPESPRIDAALLGKAICLSLRGEHEQAESLFAGLEKRMPNFYLRHPEILYYWGRNDLILERFQQGREKFFLALNIGQQPQDSSLLLAHIGDSFRSQDEPERAAAYYRLTTKLFPGSDGAIVSRVRLAEESGNMELMAEIVREYPQSEMAEFALAKMAVNYHDKTNYHEAIRMVEQLERGYPDSSLKKESRRLLRRSLQERVEQLRSKGDYWELLALLKRVKPWLSDIYRLRAELWEAEAYVELGMWDEAVAALQAISADELEEGSRLQWTLILAQAYESKGELVLAESLLRGLAASVSAGETAARVGWLLANVYQKAGNHEDGLATFRNLLNQELTETVRATTLMAMVRSLMALGRHNEAKDACQHLLSLLSEGDQAEGLRAAAWAELGEIHYRQKSYELAAAAYEKALQYGENSPSAAANHQRSRLATCYDKMGAQAKAKQLYQRIEKEAGDLWRRMASVTQRIQELETEINQVKPPDS
jgi:tetratricopeptide (TPR) repeat protein